MTRLQKIALAVVITLALAGACYFAGPDTCSDLRRPENCPRVAP